MPTLRDVPLGEIESSLKKLSDSAKALNKINASLFNLIIYTDEKRRTNAFEKVIHSILEKYPCRIIFIQGDKVDPHHMTVDISNEPIGKGNLLIACDQITIKAGLKELVRIPSIVLPLLIPDLPINLLWGQDPTKENPILTLLETFSRRLIFDSECTENLQGFFKRVEKMHVQEKIELIDITWAKISGIRDALATIFASTGKIDQLKRTMKIQIVYNFLNREGISHPEAPAIYLQGWLASQMKWKFLKLEHQNDEYHLFYEGLEIQLVSKEDPLSLCGEILDLEFTSQDNHFIRLFRDPEGGKLIVHNSTLEHCDLPYTLPLADLQRDFAFMREIFYHHPSCHYREMIHHNSQIDWNA